MQRTLKEHISRLEEKIENLKVQENDLNRTAEERYQATIDLGIAEKALGLYRKAYDLEQKVSQSGLSPLG